MEYDEENFDIEVNGNTVILRKYSGDDEVIVIPEGVTDIGFEAFGESLKDKGYCAREIVLPETLEGIMDGCFAGFRNLEKINLPSRLHALTGLCFFNCPKLKELVIPASVSRLGWIVLAENNINLILPDNIQSISERCVYIRNSFSNEETVKALLKNPVYEVIDDFMVNTNTMTLLFKLHRDSSEIVVPDGIEIIASGAFDESDFYSCDLTENQQIELNNSSRLKKITFPSSLRLLETDAFQWCTELEEIVCEANSDNLEIAFDAFSDCQIAERLKGKALISGRPSGPRPGDRGGSDKESLKGDKNKRFTHLMLERLVIINKLIRSGQCLNSEKIRQLVNQELNLVDIEDQYSLRTISTDIETLINRFNAPVKFDRKRRGYIYTKDFELVF